MLYKIKINYNERNLKKKYNFTNCKLTPVLITNILQFIYSTT